MAAEVGPGSRLPAGLGPALLALARKAVETWVREGRRIDPPASPAALSVPRGVFVTLKKDGELRGCIGYPTPVLPLGQAVVAAAVAAASEDPRFPPVTPGELAQLDVEVSVLTVPRRCRPEQVIPGRDGLIVSSGGRRGLLLPQVAGEHGWDRERFLAETCRKAGLEPDAWRRGATIERFEAEVFSAGA